MSPFVSVVIVTVDGAVNVERLVESLLCGSLVPDEIVVVNNGAGTARWSEWLEVAVHFPNCRSVHAGRGVNVSAARNIGATVARGNVLLFIDDDNVVGRRTVEVLVSVVSAYPAIVAVPVMYLCGGGEIWFAGASLGAWSGRTRFRRELPPFGGEVWPTDDIPNIACMRRGDWDRVGGYDEVWFPMHREETDLLLRLRCHGVHAVVARDAEAYHSTSTVRGLRDEIDRILSHGGELRLRAWSRARPRFHRRHSSGLRKMTTLLVFVPLWAGMAVVSLCLRDVRLGGRFMACAQFVMGLCEGYVGRKAGGARRAY